VILCAHAVSDRDFLPLVRCWAARQSAGRRGGRRGTSARCPGQRHRRPAPARASPRRVRWCRWRWRPELSGRPSGRGRRI